MMDTPVARPLPFFTGLRIFVRMLALQSSWNYETMLGTGIGFSLEPALRALPGGRGGEPYHAALPAIDAATATSTARIRAESP